MWINVVAIKVLLVQWLIKVSPTGVFPYSRTDPGANCWVSRFELLFPHQWETNFPERLQLDPSSLLPGPSQPCRVSLVWKAAFLLDLFESSLVRRTLINNYDNILIETRNCWSPLSCLNHWVCFRYEYINTEPTSSLFVLQLKELVAVSRGCEHERPEGLGRRSVRAGSVLQHLWRDGNHGNYWHPLVISVLLYSSILLIIMWPNLSMRRKTLLSLCTCSYRCFLQYFNKDKPVIIYFLTSVLK